MTFFMPFVTVSAALVKLANKGVYDNHYEMYPYLGKFMQEVNYNVYNLIEYFDK